VKEKGEFVRSCKDDDGELAWPSKENTGDLRVSHVEDDEIRLGFAWSRDFKEVSMEFGERIMQYWRRNHFSLLVNAGIRDSC
jgi:hypothetical protein